jgi:putative hydrolase of the HAD superfamily
LAERTRACHRWPLRHRGAARQRDEVSRTQPQIAHDFSAVRRESIRIALSEAGDDPTLAEPAFDVFFAARHELEFYPEVVDAIERLARRYPLFALSNGNAEITRTALGPWFRGAISAREFGIGKPDRASSTRLAGAWVASRRRCCMSATTSNSMCWPRDAGLQTIGCGATSVTRRRRPARRRDGERLRTLAEKLGADPR